MRTRTHIPHRNPHPDRALISEAKKAAKAAARADFRRDALFSSEISKIISVANSAVKRHGPLIELGFVEAWQAAGMEVLRNVAFPVTHAALGIATSRDHSILAGSQIDFNEKDIAGSVDFDAIVFDPSNRWVGGFQIKRGGGQTESRKRRACEREIRAANFIIASWARQKGYREIEAGAAAVIDFYGQSGFANEITISPDKIDDFFGLPIVASIDEMTEAMSEALADEMSGMLATLAPRAKEGSVEETGQGDSGFSLVTPLYARRRSRFETFAPTDRTTSFAGLKGRR